MNLKSEKWWAGVKLLPSLFRERKAIRIRHEGSITEWVGTGAKAPGEENALHHVEVLHQHVPLGFGAQVADGVADAQLDGPLQSGGGRLEEEKRRCEPSTAVSRQAEWAGRGGHTCLLVGRLSRGIYPPVANLLLVGRARS